jgi:polysaccharide pyruvyl transferase WcaK-like protein/sulfatase maturation enzyme AslB (radical SAM superfamily)
MGPAASRPRTARNGRPCRRVSSHPVLALLSDVSIASKLRSLRYVLQTRPYALEKPRVLQFPVIDICNSQCQMCRIWENKQSQDVTPEQLAAALRNSLFTEVVAVGLNGGEPTLRADLADLAEALFSRLPKLRHLSLITNAYKYKQVIERIDEVAAVVRCHGGQFDVMVSLDGYGEVHDLVRGKPRNFQRAQYVIDHVTASPLVDSVRIGCTIVKANVFGLADLHSFCRRRGVYVKYRMGIPHQRLYTQNLLDPYALDEEEIFHVIEFLEGLLAHYETNDLQRLFYRSLIGQLRDKAPRRAGCDWQHRGATITSRGELLYCAVRSKPLANIIHDDSQARYFESASHLREIVDQHCSSCLHDYTGQPDRRDMAGLAARRLLDRLGVDSAKRQLVRRWPPFTWLRRHRFEQRRSDHLATAQDAGTTVRRLANRHRVTVCGWYGTETLGDKAILGGIVRSLESALGPIDLTLVSLQPYVSRITRRQMPELRGATIATAREAITRMGSVDLLVFGGGPLMAIDEMAEMEALFDVARRAGVPSVVAGCGVGPLGESWHDAAVARLLSLASARLYRDAASLAQARALGVVDGPHDAVCEDPAFTWLAARPPAPARALVAAGAPEVLLLGLRAFPHDQYARHLALADRLRISATYEACVVDALEQLVARRPGLRLLPVPMCTNHFGGDDRWFYDRLLGDNAKLTPHIDRYALGRELAPTAAAELFSSAHAALTMRFHAMVFALGLGVPVVGIDYTLGRGKVGALAQYGGVPCFSLDRIDVGSLLTSLTAQLDASSTVAPAAPTFSGALGNALRGLGLQQRGTTEVAAS